MDVEDAEVMKALTAMCLESATAMLAGKAREFALTLPPEITGSQALVAFADAIETTNGRQWPIAGKG